MIHTQRLLFRKVSVCQQSHHSDSWDTGVNSTPCFRKWSNCGSCAVKTSLHLGLTELLLRWEECFNYGSQTGWVTNVWVFCRVLFWRMETGVLCPLNFTIALPSPWVKKDTAWEDKPRPFTKRLVFVRWPQSRGWSEMHSTCHPKAGRAPSSQKSAGCQDSVCVGLEFGSFVIWSLPKVTAGEGTLWGCGWRAMPWGCPAGVSGSSTVPAVPAPLLAPLGLTGLRKSHSDFSSSDGNPL